MILLNVRICWLAKPLGAGFWKLVYIWQNKCTLYIGSCNAIVMCQVRGQREVYVIVLMDNFTLLTANENYI